MSDQGVITAERDQHAGTRACLERLAAVLSGYSDLDVAVCPDGPAPCLAVRNTGHPFMSETVAVARVGGGLAFAWSWGQRIGDASDPGAAAQAIAYVLEARGVRLGAR